jgi:hypothetical protein
MAISPRLRIKQLLTAGVCLLLPMSVQGCTNLSSIHINPFIIRFAADGSSLKQQDIQRAYDQSLAATHLAILGSELPRPLILNSYWKFLTSIIARSSPEVFQGRLTSLGYFSAPTLSAIEKFCITNNPYLGAAIIRRQKIEESSAPCAGKSKSIRIPIGYSVRGFIVPKSNNFATVIPLDILAELSRKRSQITWNDINPAWPRRPIQWVFSSQTDFKDDLRILGITPPSQYLLAANYDRGFMNIPDHPDSLLFSPTSPSLSSLLRGAQFRLLPVQITRSGKPIKPEPEPEELERYPQELVRTVYLYINPDNPSSCIMFDFADFILTNNKQLMHENNFIPLRQNEITTALQQLRESRGRSYKESQPLCSGYQALFDQTNQPAQSTKP